MSKSCRLCGIRVLPEATRGHCRLFCAWGGAQLIYESTSILHCNHICKAIQGQIQYKQSFQQVQLSDGFVVSTNAGHVAVVGRTQPPGPFRRVCFVVLVSWFHDWETGCQKNLRHCQNSTLLFGGWDLVVFDTWDLQVFVATLIWVHHNTLFLGRSCDLSSLPQLLKCGTWTFGKEKPVN